MGNSSSKLHVCPMVEITEDPATRKVDIRPVQMKSRPTSRVPGGVKKAEGRPAGIIITGAARPNVQDGPLEVPKLRREEKDGGADREVWEIRCDTNSTLDLVHWEDHRFRRLE
jgi:hypothetical protein